MTKRRRYPQQTPRKKDFGKMAENLVISLNKDNLGAYIHTVARTGSAYIRFEDPSLGSIRLGDHDGIERYKYKFNVRTDVDGFYWRKENNIWRFYCSTQHLDKLKEQILKTRDFRKNMDKSKWNENRQRNEHDRQQRSVSSIPASDNGMDRPSGSGDTQGDQAEADRPREIPDKPRENTGQESNNSSEGKGNPIETRRTTLSQILKRLFGPWT